jgi:predicted ATPase
MYFELKNIGAIKHAKVELGKLTVICGKNNTGKTYITYSIYGLIFTHFF